MEAFLCELGKVEEKELKFAVISAKYEDKWIFVRHKERETWEIPGGHREANEDIIDTARRELYEETGAKTANIIPICEYGVKREDGTSYGRLFYADVIELDKLPNSEIEKIELFDELPNNLTYPQIQPKLYKTTLEFINEFC